LHINPTVINAGEPVGGSPPKFDPVSTGKVKI